MSQQLIQKFYEAFQNGDASTMASCYHDEATFNDPAFKDLNSDQVKAMWAMLIERSKGNLEIDFHSIVSDALVGNCIWEAKYPFSKTGNMVHNIIHAEMEFKDGLILKHEDHFNFWRWSSMALGTTGKILGWTPFLKGKVQKMAMKSLHDYMNKG